MCRENCTWSNTVRSGYPRVACHDEPIKPDLAPTIRELQKDESISCPRANARFWYAESLGCVAGAAQVFATSWVWPGQNLAVRRGTQVPVCPPSFGVCDTVSQRMRCRRLQKHARTSLEEYPTVQDSQKIRIAMATAVEQVSTSHTVSWELHAPLPESVS